MLIMANRVTPTRYDVDNSSGFPAAACNDWRIAGRFHVGTGHSEPTQDAGYTTAGDSPRKAKNTISLDLRGSPYTRSYASSVRPQLPNDEPTLIAVVVVFERGVLRLVIFLLVYNLDRLAWILLLKFRFLIIAVRIDACATSSPAGVSG